MAESGNANPVQATERVTLQELFRYLLRTEKDYPYDLKSQRLVGVISEVFHLTYNQVTRALFRLETRKFLQVSWREGVEIALVEIVDRDWTRAPKSPI